MKLNRSSDRSQVFFLMLKYKLLICTYNNIIGNMLIYQKNFAIAKQFLKNALRKKVIIYMVGIQTFEHTYVIHSHIQEILQLTKCHIDAQNRPEYIYLCVRDF